MSYNNKKINENNNQMDSRVGAMLRVQRFGGKQW